MQDLKRSLKVAGKGRVFERVYRRPKKLGSRAGYPTSREPSPTPIGSDRGHPCSFKGYPDDQEERGTGHGFGRELSRRATL